MKKSLLIKISTLALSVCSLLYIGTACKEEHTHSYTETVTAPTCTEQGFTTYTCSCGDSYVDAYVNALGHDFTNYTYNNDAKCGVIGTETATCNNGCGTTDTRYKFHTALQHEYIDYVYNNDAKCEENGTETATCNHGCGATDKREKANTALSHNYDAPVYSWSGQQCTATRVCKNDQTHKETETVIGEYIKDTSATCTTAEKGHYFATFTNSAFAEQTTALNSVANGEALNHNFGTVTYTWNNNYAQCTATRICSRDNTHIDDEIVNTTYNVITESTYDEVGQGRYTAIFKNPAFFMQLYDVEIPKIIRPATISNVENGTIIDFNILIIVDKSVPLLQLGGMITTTENSSWELYKDSDFTQVITSKNTGQLSNGDNIYYLKVKSNDNNDVNKYTLTIHRSYEVNVIFYDGSHLLKAETLYTGVEYDTNYIPVIKGYNFNYWKDNQGIEFSKHVIFSNENYYADKTKKQFTITMDKDGGEYAFETFDVTFDEEFFFSTATKENYEFLGWEYNNTLITDSLGNGLSVWDIDSENIALKAKFKPFVFTVSLESMVNDNVSSSGGSIIGSGNFDYASEQEVVADTNLGYVFLGWFDGEKKLTTEEKYKFSVAGTDKTYTAKWAIAKKMELFDFVSTKTTCNIVGIKDSDIEILYIPDYVSRIDIIALNKCGHINQITVDKDNETYTAEGNCLIEKQINTVVFGCKTSILPNSGDIISIGSYAFSSIELYNIEIPSNIKEISKLAFNNCENLKSINVQKENLIYSSVNGVVYNKEETEILLIPKGIEQIVEFPTTLIKLDDYAFFGCSKLKIVSIPLTVTSIGQSIFKGCSALEEITIPYLKNDAVDLINLGYYFEKDGSTFYSQSYREGTSSNIKNIYEANNYYLIYMNEESYYSQITGTEYGPNGGISRQYRLNKYYGYYIPCSLKSVTVLSGDIPQSAFFNCVNIKEFVLPTDLTVLDRYTFYNCRSLENIELPNIIKSIRSQAFYNCEQLKTVTIPKSVTSIYDNAFENCYNLFVVCNLSASTISVGKTYACIVTEDINYEVISSDDYLFVKDNTGYYLVKYTGNAIDLVLPEEINKQSYNIVSFAFKGCESLNSITIPKTVNSIGYAAFNGCSNLTSITLPFIGDKLYDVADTKQHTFGYVFGSESYTGSIAVAQSIYIGDDGSTSSKNTYYLPKNLETVTITSGDILAYAFSGCTNIVTINLPLEATIIKKGAFSGCSQLQEIDLPDNLLTIESYAFYNCAKIENLIIPNSVTRVDEYAFEGCKNLNFNIYDNAYYLGNSDNNYLILIKAVSTTIQTCEIHQETTVICSRAFEDCTSLISMRIPNNVLMIGDFAFIRCTDLETVIISKSVEYMGNGVFYYSDNLTLFCEAPSRPSTWDSHWSQSNNVVNWNYSE